METDTAQTESAPTQTPLPAPPSAQGPRKGANFIQISADCTCLRINYTKAVRTADDGIEITCPDVETFRSLNKYLVDFKVQFHTYALEEKRKIKVVIRGIPADFPVEEIKADLCAAKASLYFQCTGSAAATAHHFGWFSRPFMDRGGQKSVPNFK
ncbi:hypothetical protein EVAR_46104_1 [Eumeta japonica]|uniref:Nucleic-acid-binding protein from transposon X-element n=1 Tax=Eumeta variegata TaxID=151549 RepID=A0A4C1XIW3_EUMVA|nr:hypothetical protein EVAR_46104_1 [Eumeta japonica]